jgi:hypothetical protein
VPTQDLSEILTYKGRADLFPYIEQVIAGARAAIRQAKRCAARHPDVEEFAEKLTAIMKRGIARLDR